MSDFLVNLPGPIGLPLLAALAEADELYPLALLFVVVVLAPFVLGPIMVHRNQWSGLEPQYQVFDPEGRGSPPELAGHYAWTAKELGSLGFGPECSVRNSKSSPNASGFVSLFRDRRHREVAKILTAVAVQGPIRNATSFVVFVTEFADGTEVMTSNNPSSKVFPSRRPPFHGFTFPRVPEIDRLLALHRALVRRYEDGLIRVDPVGDDPHEYLRQRDHVLPLTRCVAHGYYYIDKLAGLYRPTWKGAILMSWKLTPPIKQVRQAWTRIKEEWLLRALDTI